MTPDPAALLDLMRRRRTARRHRPGKVPDAALDAVLEAGRWSPSAANRQPWRFSLIRNPALQADLRSAFLAEAIDHDAKYRAVTEGQADLLLAPALVLVCGETDTKARYVNAASLGDQVQEELFLLSMGACIQNMLLMAEAQGLSATWIARAARLPDVRAMLGVSGELRSLAFIALGVAEAPSRWSEQMRSAVAAKMLS